MIYALLKHLLVAECLEKIGDSSEDFFKFVDLLEERSENWKLVNSFLWNECSALVHLLQSLQSGIHSDRNIAIKRMIPNFFSLDATHYKR